MTTTNASSAPRRRPRLAAAGSGSTGSRPPPRRRRGRGGANREQLADSDRNPGPGDDGDRLDRALGLRIKKTPSTARVSAAAAPSRSAQDGGAGVHRRGRTAPAGRTPHVGEPSGGCEHDGEDGGDQERIGEVAEERVPAGPNRIGDDLVLEMPDQHPAAAPARPSRRSRPPPRPRRIRARHRSGATATDRAAAGRRSGAATEEPHALGELDQVDPRDARGQLDVHVADLPRHLVSELRRHGVDRRRGQRRRVREVEKQRAGIAREELRLERPRGLAESGASRGVPSAPTTTDSISGRALTSFAEAAVDDGVRDLAARSPAGPVAQSVLRAGGERVAVEMFSRR